MHSTQEAFGKYVLDGWLAKGNGSKQVQSQRNSIATYLLALFNSREAVTPYGAKGMGVSLPYVHRPSGGVKPRG